ncbi:MULTISPECIES: ABC-three component system protein [Rahnella]|uniref:ABC-three component systems C-terminal domain-containing protein n=1 Tax=Rahnella laticis TaxID=2787622 RepID=A0ABS0E0D4_9GAMM|nr:MULTISPECIES: ABC-three component system protein [Rahnella]MBF7978563.1 hypothetical protein [Rahnella laticis]MBF7998653.1 hypothetical protein [Rahnella sp. LAC-M12]
MVIQTSFTDKTNDDDKEIGFRYQYYYFLYRLLNIKAGQSVGLEVKDDVHTELNNDSQILFQLKHTVQTDASGNPISLTELDIDLWKTLHNWVKIITDPIDGRGDKTEQKAFINKTEFHLVTNKSESLRNTLLIKFESYKSSEIKLEILHEYIKSLYKKTENSKIKTYINTLLALEKDVLKPFLMKVNFKLDEIDVIGLIKKSIKEKMIDDSKIDLVFQKLDSSISTDNFIAVKEGRKIVIDFDSFYKRYRNIFAASRERLSINRSFSFSYPTDIYSQVFIKQLIDINALKVGDTEKALELTTSKLKITRLLDEWIQQGELVSFEISDFHNDVRKKWLNAFEHWCENCNEEHIVSHAKSLLYDLRQKEFILIENNLSTELSNGELYKLSDEKLIGWHRDWKIK